MHKNEFNIIVGTTRHKSTTKEYVRLEKPLKEVTILHFSFHVFYI